MTIQRLYNFNPGQIIQSAQVNDEFDQLVSAMNNYVIDANYSSNSVVNDGDVVSAISAIDSYLADNPPGGILTQNYSRNAIICPRSRNSRWIQLRGTPGNPIIVSKPDGAFMENITVELYISDGNTFNDIYIQNETTLPAIVPGTKRIKLVAKNSGSAPYQTYASEGQHLIGSVYVYNGTLIGIHNLETPNTATYHEAIWGLNNELNALLTETPVIVATCRIPVFVQSVVQYTVKTQVYTTGESLEWNYMFYVKKNGNNDHYYQERVPALPNGMVGNTGRVCVDRSYDVVPGLYTYDFAGEIYSSESAFIFLNRLYAHFVVRPSHICFKAN